MIGTKRPLIIFCIDEGIDAFIEITKVWLHDIYFLSIVLRQSWQNPHNKRTSIKSFCCKKWSKSMKNAFVLIRTNWNDFFWSSSISKNILGEQKVKMTTQTTSKFAGVFDHREGLSKKN